MATEIESSSEQPPLEVNPAPPEPIKPRKSRACLIAFIFILLILVAAAVGAFLFWKKYQTDQIKHDAQVEKEIQKLQGHWVNTQAQLANQSHQVELIQQSLQQFQKENWPLAQAQYLVKLAAYNLAFENNPELAAQILKAADAQLQATNDPSLLAVRQAVAADVADLKAVSAVDIGGIITTLNAVSQQVEKLPRIAVPAVQATSRPTTDVEKKPAASQVSAWKTRLYTFGDDVWQVLRSMVVIHYNKPQAAPLLPPEQYVYVITNIQSQLSLAQWAVLHQQATIYQQSLDQASSWINRYFPASEPAVAAVLKQLQTLRQISVKPELPDLSRSLQAITQAMDKAS